MKKVKLVAAALFVFLLFPTSSQAALREFHVEFFSDAALDNMVGETVDWCDDSETSWGNINADYIANYHVSCSTSEVTDVTCYHWTGSSYVPMDCYWDELRVRIPVGRQ